MFNINFDKLINNNLDNFPRQTRFVNRLKSVVYEVKNLYNLFIAFRDEYLVKAEGTGQVIYLEKLLNDKWDNINRGIFISDTLPDPFYLYKKSELQPPIYIYKKFSPTHTYAPGEFCLGSDNVVYIAAFTSTNKDPVNFPGFWSGSINPPPWLRNKYAFNGSINFIVNVPNTVVFDQNEMKALINYYKIAGKFYIINTF